MSRRLALSAAAALAIGLLVGCTDPSPESSPSATEAPTQPSTPSPEATTATPEPGNQADIDFANAIRIYHAQSSQMHQAVVSKSGVPAAVLTLAGTLANVQGRESVDLDALLVSWGEEPADPTTADTRTGMLSPEELQELFTGSGSDATVVYLNGMIGHHEATLVLAEGVLTAGTSPEVAVIAEEMVASQPEELAELRELLATADPTPAESESAGAAGESGDAGATG